MYPLLRNLMFKLDAETSHHLGMNSLKWMEMSGLLRLLMPKMPTVPVHVMGLRFPNPVGLAAGLDKNADYLEWVL